MSLPVLLTIFAISAAFVAIAGYVLTKAGDELGDRLNLGGSWIGLVLMAGVTSLPEVVASVTSAFWDQPGLACGNVFGSNAFNLVIIVFLDILYRGGPISFQFGNSPIFAGGLGLTLTCIGALAVLSSKDHIFPGNFLPEVVWSLIILGFYLLAMFAIYRYETKTPPNNSSSESSEETPVELIPMPESGSMKPLLMRLGISAGIVLVSGVLLVFAADRLAVYPFSFGQLGHTFVGSLGLAVVTSLPEVVVCIVAIRLGNFGMAVGNIFGSNLFNMAILALSQLAHAPFYAHGFYETAGVGTLFGSFLAMAMTGLAISGLIYRSSRLVLGMGWDSWVLLITYVAGMYLLFEVQG